MDDLICRPFARMDGPAPFSDSICLTQAQWDALSANALTDMQNARFMAWMELYVEAQSGGPE
jgi:hypothetical protein